MGPLEFLNLLWEHKPPETFVLIWTRQGKESRWFCDLGAAAKFVEAHSRDIYVGVGLSPCAYGTYNRCRSDKIAGIAGLWADFDLRSEVHSKKALPTSNEEALSLIPAAFPPTIVIFSGNGLHVWWLFREPLIFETDEQRKHAASLAFRWQTLLRLNAAAQGWAFDCLADLARVLRIPGTQNCKDERNPKPVSVLSQTSRRYDPADFEEFLEEHEIPGAEDQARAAEESEVNFADTPLSVNPSATVPEDFLNKHMAADARFKSTWLRQREDLKDDSQSGYDLALANFGVRAGLSEQQIADLIIHHRRIHSQRPRARVEYFRQTISKASKHYEDIVPSKALAAGSESGQARSEEKPGSDVARGLLCEHISNVIGVRVLRIVKIAGQEPTYRLELEAVKIAFPSVNKLVGQQSFRMKIAGAVQHLVPIMSRKSWDRVAQIMLDAVTVEDGGDEADLVGSARMYVERYLSETPFIDPEEDHPYQTRYKPAVYEGQVAICSHDLQQHINKAWGENRALNEVTAILSALGASSTRIKRTRLRDQSRWLLPSSQFPPDAQVGAGEETSNGRTS